MGGWLTRILDVLRGRARLRREPVPPHQLDSIDAVIEQMQVIGSRLGPDDGLGAFNGMYLRVTQLIRDNIVEGRFRNAEFITRLDVVFAHLYLDAVDTQPPSSAWAPLFEARHVPGRLPIQFALAGMNAHINHDLPIAVVRTCRQLGLGPRSAHVESDYLLVTDMLAAAQEEVRQSFMAGLALELDRAYAAPLANLVGAWSMARAREAAWVNALVLWNLHGTGRLNDEFLTTLSSSVGLAGRTLLTPLNQLR